MKLVDERGRLFGAFNIVDICIIIFVAAVAFVGYLFLSNTITKSAPTQNVRITMELKNVEKELCDAIEVDKTVFDRVGNQKFGILTDARIKPATEVIISKLDGVAREIEVADRYNVELDMELTTDEKVYVGKNISIATKDFTGAGYVINLEKLDE